MGRIQNRVFEIEAGQLGLIPQDLESTRPLVNSALGPLGQVYSPCYSITKGDVVHVLICQKYSTGFVCIGFSITIFFSFLTFEIILHS